MAEKNSINLLSLTAIVDDKIPLAAPFSWHLPPVKNLTRSEHNIKDLNIELFNKLYNCYLSHPKKDQIKIVLKHYNDSKNGGTLIQKLIDIRTCLESIFLTDQEMQELRYRLSLRAAIFEQDTTKKNYIRKGIKDLYDYSSSAIHNGKISTKNKTKAGELYTEMLPFIRSTIEFIICNKEIDWPQSEIEGEIVFIH